MSHHRRMLLCIALGAVLVLVGGTWAVIVFRGTNVHTTTGCPADPGVPGFRYECGPGVAHGHRGETCISHPPECPVGDRVIRVDPTNSDPQCVLANEVANARAGGAQLDPNGDCPPTAIGHEPDYGPQDRPTTTAPLPPSPPASAVPAVPQLTG
jgi:hypothetical protein